MMAQVYDPGSWLVLVNPASGAGRAARFAPRLAAALGHAGLSYRRIDSAKPGDLGRMVTRAVQDRCRRLLAVGGDGTALIDDGRLAGDPAFHVTRCCTATISADPPCGVEPDGEIFGSTPVTISMLPGALSALDCRQAPRA